MNKLTSESFPSIDIAASISRKLAEEHDFPHFENKVDALWEALIDAERAHDEALHAAMVKPEMNKNEKRLIKPFEKALTAIEECNTGWAFYDSDLDHSYENPNSKTDLKGMLKRAIVALKTDPFDVRKVEDPITGKKRRSLRNIPGTKSDGLAAMVESLHTFWRLSEAPASFAESTVDASDKGHNQKRINNPALRLVFESAKNIDHRYNLDNCVNAICGYRTHAISLRAESSRS